jgi:hypothetical protein
MLSALLDNIAEPALSVSVMGVPLDAVAGSSLLDVSVSRSLGAADHATLRLGAWSADHDSATNHDH